jgi:hypothetical protein
MPLCHSVLLLVARQQAWFLGSAGFWTDFREGFVVLFPVSTTALSGLNSAFRGKIKQLATRVPWLGCGENLFIQFHRSLAH